MRETVTPDRLTEISDGESLLKRRVYATINN